jgi:hypothetical protein
MANCRLCKAFASHRPETLLTALLITLSISLLTSLPILLPIPQELLLVPVA